MGQEKLAADFVAKVLARRAVVQARLERLRGFLVARPGDKPDPDYAVAQVLQAVRCAVDELDWLNTLCRPPNVHERDTVPAPDDAPDA